MMMRYILFVVMVIFISGCSLKPTPLPQTNELRLQTIMLAKQSQRELGVLKIEKIKGVNYINNKNFVYGDGLGIYHHYAYHRWAEPVANQLETMIAHSLQELGIFQTVTTSSSKVLHNFMLEARVDAFEHIVSQDISKVLITIDLKLIDANTRILIDSKNFTIQKQTPTKDAKGALSAYNEASFELMQQISFWLLKIF